MTESVSHTWEKNSDQLPTHLRMNKGNVTRDRLGWLKPTPADTSIPEIRRLLEQDGYVWVKNLLPRADVLKMREDFFAEYAGTGLLKPGTREEEGIYNNADDITLHRGIGGPGQPANEDLKRLTAAHQTSEYLDFTNHPDLRKMVRQIMSWDEEIMLRRTLLRHAVPGADSTGIHYDKLFLRDGTAFFLTAWIPIGDVDARGGGLYYLEDSTHLGEEMELDFQERARGMGLSAEERVSAFNRNMAASGYLADHPDEFMDVHRRVISKVERGEGQKTMAEPLSTQHRYQWLVADYEAGDVVFHHPCMIHGSCGNDDPSHRIRLSTDLRFYDKKVFDQGDADERWMDFWRVDDRL